MESRSKGLYILVAVCVAAVVAAAMSLPGARLSFLLPAAAVCGTAVMYAYSLCRFRSVAGAAILMVGYTLVVCGIIWNIHYFTVESGGTYAFPVLENNDAHTDWARAVAMLYGDPAPQFEGLLGIRYYNFIIQGLILVFGRDIGVPLMFNALCYPLAIILIGAVAWELTLRRTTVTATMAVATLMCYLMVQATVLIKDVPLTMFVAAVVLVMVRWHRHSGTTIGDLCILVPGVVGVAFLRANFLPMLFIGIVLFGFRRNFSFDRRFLWFGVCVILLFIAMHTFFEFPEVGRSLEGESDRGVFVHHRYVRAWDDILVDNYEKMPVWRRVLWLPASVLVQYLIPFPWNFERDMIFGPTECVAHFGYFWYYAGAVLLFWIFAMQRTSDASMRMLVLWGVILTVLTAYITSGRVSRYCLVYLPMLLPAVGYTLTTLAAEPKSKKTRKFLVWLGVFTALLVPVLIVCHHLQMSA